MSDRFEVGLIARDQTEAVQHVLETNLGYGLRVGGTKPLPDAADDVLTALPPGVDAAQKIDIGVWEGETLVAFADVICGWPSADAAHIGSLMTDGERHGQGLGRRMHNAVVDLVGEWPQITMLRLSIVDTNADLAEPFWMKLGYTPAGETEPYISGAVELTARVCSRPVVEAVS